MGGWAGGKEEAKIVISHSLAWDNQPKIYPLFHQSVKRDLIEEVEDVFCIELKTAPQSEEEEKTRM